MRLDVVEIPGRLGPADRSSHLFIVVDVLRASSTMLTAFSNGCESVIAVAEPPEAFALCEGRPELLLAGERYGHKIAGFNLGNSPFEMTHAAVGGRTLVTCTTNGTKAIVASQVGAETIVGAFLNASAATAYARAARRDVTILCSGKFGAHALEDLACAGLIAEMLTGAVESATELSAGAVEARALYRENRNDLAGFVAETEHGRYLAEIGMGRDVAYCAQVDRFELVPRLADGVIRCTD
jgi:2-phosphosulfolactate phosphatase